MRVYTYSEARQKLAEVLDMARDEDVVITRRGGDSYRLSCSRPLESPFDVPAVKTRATTHDILDVIREARARSAK